MSGEFSKLLQKYNVPGPRYTSYPTVPYWTTTPSQAQWITALQTELSQAEAKGVGAALYVHIPFCRSLCTYCGCNTRITRNEAVSVPYVDAVLAEWGLYRKLLGRKKPMKLSELHFGGGTPTFLPPAELGRLVDGILEFCDPAPDAEFSVEADPRTTTREHLEVLAQRGFHRLSLGIQDFDPRVQDIVHRVQSEEEVATVVNEARELGFTSVNFDLIYGLPLQTLESVATTVEAVKRLRPDRIAFYAYAHVPWIKPGQRRFSEADLPSGETKRLLYEQGRGALEAAGYREVGMDHFALESDDLWKASNPGTLHRNFMGYTPRLVMPQIGLGVSSIGDAWSVFAQNEKILEKYEERVKKGELPILRGHCLNAEDQVLRRHVLNIMTRFQTSWQNEEAFTPFLETIPPRLQEFIEDGLIQWEPQVVVITEKGKPFLRNICMAFDARLVKQAPQTQLFSKTI